MDLSIAVTRLYDPDQGFRLNAEPAVRSLAIARLGEEKRPAIYDPPARSWCSFSIVRHGQQNRVEQNRRRWGSSIGPVAGTGGWQGQTKNRAPFGVGFGPETPIMRRDDRVADR